MKTSETFELDERHPLFGVSSAWYQFAVKAPDGVFRRLLLVQAKNQYAIYLLELVLGETNGVCNSCSLMMRIQEDPALDAISEFVDECPFVDFILDVVGTDRLLNTNGRPDTRKAWAFQRSLSEEEISYAKTKCRATPVEAPKYEATRKVAKPAKLVKPAPEAAELLQSALTNLGFKKQAVVKFVEAQDAMFFESSVPDQIKAGLAALT